MRLDKYLKVSRLIKRRTVANEACDNSRRWRMKRGDFEEVPRLSAATAGESRLARRWADMGPALRECVLKDCRHAGPALRSV